MDHHHIVSVKFCLNILNILVHFYLILLRLISPDSRRFLCADLFGITSYRSGKDQEGKMNKLSSMVIVITMIVAFSAASANAQSWCGGTGTSYYYYNGSYSPYQNGTCHGWTSTGSGHVFGVNMYWNQSGRNGVQGYVSSGKRYTHDMTDLNDNLSATGTYSTNFPSPYIDFDDDDGNGEWEEWEVTVENSSFPVVGRKYYLQFWSTWKSSAGASGNVAYTPAISEKLWYTSDKWDTYRYDRGLNRHYKKTGNLFESEEMPSNDLFKPRPENENEKQFEHRRFEEPVSIEDFAAQISKEQIEIGGIAMEYEVETEDGPQVITVGLPSKADELIPTATLQEVLAAMPETYSINKFRGIVSYYFDPIKNPHVVGR